MTPARALSHGLLAVAAGVFASAPAGAAFSLFGYHCCYHMASGSMLPTLLPDQVFAAEAYSPSNPAEAGDIILFKRPALGQAPYVKRIVGLPGDRVQMIAGALYVNGKAVKRERIGAFANPLMSGPSAYRRRRETLANGASYQTVDEGDDYDYGNTPVFDMRAGEYFVLGDTRNNSWDSREPRAFGNVPLSDILGKVKLP
jgi:signal peptidase I